MAPLSKLTLTSYRRTQPNRDPVEERRSKTLAALEQQKLVLAAALNGQEHTVTKPGWIPKIVDWYMDGKIEIDPMITHKLKLEDINHGFDLMHEGKSIRAVVEF